MKHSNILFIFFSLVLCLVSSKLFGLENYQSEIQNLQDVVSVKKIASHAFFNEAYEIMVKEPLDHSNPTKGFFEHRVILSIKDKQAPIVFVTEGYNANRALDSTRINELTTMTGANQLIVEHRYFSKSKPDTLNWDYLTVENSAHDLHHIYQMFSKMFPNSKWISTGISKGGQTTLCYKAFYPNDMDVWIAYVAPLNFRKFDQRINRFLEQVGPVETREKIESFQQEILMRRASMLPKLDSLMTANKYESPLNTTELLDYCVFEYEFSFWQWGHPAEKIPSINESDQQLFDYLVKIAGPDYFSTYSHSAYQSFFVQAAKEMGYYTYDFKPLKKYTSVKNTNDYVNKVMLPDVPPFKFTKKTMKKVDRSLKRNSKNVILIYGEYDPWSATHCVPGEGALKVIKPEGDHRTRIKNLPNEQKTEVQDQISKWLGIEINN